jgi:plastocyanin
MRPNGSTWTRRRVLTAAGTATIAGLAGCSTSAGGDGDDPTTTPTGADEGGNEHHDDEHSDTATHEEEAQHEHGGGLPEEPAASATVSMVTTEDGAQHFEPHVVWVEQGATVTWELESGTHTATAYAAANDLPQRIPDGGAAFDSGVVSEAGATFEQTFETPGVYDYVCTPHRTVGMIGTVVVGEPDAHGQPGLEEPASDLQEKERHKLEELNGQVDEMLGHTH